MKLTAIQKNTYAGSHTLKLVIHLYYLLWWVELDVCKL